MAQIKGDLWIYGYDISYDHINKIVKCLIQDTEIQFDKILKTKSYQFIMLFID